jgi:leucyl-tRNA synthetase
LKGIKAINPAIALALQEQSQNNAEGALKDAEADMEIPIFISDYVLAGYGTGVIMAVPAHDERDNEFAKKFGVDIKISAAPEGVVNGINNKEYFESMSQDLKKDLIKVWTNEAKRMSYSNTIFLVNSGKFDGMDSEEAKEKITEFVGGKMTSTYRLRDWSISRQRY